MLYKEYKNTEITVPSAPRFTRYRTCWNDRNDLMDGLTRTQVLT